MKLLARVRSRTFINQGEGRRAKGEEETARAGGVRAVPTLLSGGVTVCHLLYGVATDY